MNGRSLIVNEAKPQENRTAVAVVRWRRWWRRRRPRSQVADPRRALRRLSRQTQGSPIGAPSVIFHQFPIGLNGQLIASFVLLMPRVRLNPCEADFLLLLGRRSSSLQRSSFNTGFFEAVFQPRGSSRGSTRSCPGPHTVSR